MLRSAANRLCRDESGAMTSFGLFLLMACFVIGGLGLDVASAYMARTQLQAAADVTAHAAIYLRETNSEMDAKNAALQVARTNMPQNKYGNYIGEEDIRFGIWDASAQAFNPSSGSDDAVWVDVGRAASRANPVGTYFLSFAGIGSWDVRTGAVYETYIPTCFREGFVAEDVVDVQSNNQYVNGFCIHSNTHVEVNLNNFWESNTVVSMPDIRNLVLPNSGFEHNQGLQDALRDGAYQIRILNRLESIIDDLRVAGSTYSPDYITSSSIVSLTAKTLQMSDFTPNRVHVKTCTGNQSVTLKQHETFSNVVFVTNCKINIGNNVILDNVILATTNTDAKSINASHVQLGRDDSCLPDGGSQILTMGGVEVASDLQVYGSQIIAQGNIEFAAGANGIEGASFISGGRIDGTSNMTMGFCGNGMERNFEAEYFRMVA